MQYGCEFLAGTPDTKTAQVKPELQRFACEARIFSGPWEQFLFQVRSLLAQYLLYAKSSGCCQACFSFSTGSEISCSVPLVIETTGSEVTVRLPKDARAVWASAAAVSDFTPVKIVGQTLGREARRGRKCLHKFAGPVVDKTTSQFFAGFVLDGNHIALFERSQAGLDADRQEAARNPTQGCRRLRSMETKHRYQNAGKLDFAVLLCDASKFLRGLEHF